MRVREIFFSALIYGIPKNYLNLNLEIFFPNIFTEFIKNLGNKRLLAKVVRDHNQLCVIVDEINKSLRFVTFNMSVVWIDLLIEIIVVIRTLISIIES
jgi:hypothetical protein